MSDTESRIGSVCDGYVRSVYDKNVAEFLGLYHANARVFDTWSVWSYEGVAARRQVIDDWFSSLGDERVRVTMDRREAAVTDQLAVFTARVIYAAISPQGNELRSMQNRLTWVLKPAGDVWKILHEHTSVPIGFADLKGMLERT